jgi:Ser-tRNA(Ala) deacylase AlaX
MGCDGDPGTVGGDAVTTLLYHTDSYLREMEATVTRVEGERMALDRTIFYAQSGGQPADHGTLS